MLDLGKMRVYVLQWYHDWHNNVDHYATMKLTHWKEINLIKLLIKWIY